MVVLVEKGRKKFNVRFIFTFHFSSRLLTLSYEKNKESLDILLILDGGIKAFNLFSYNYYVSWDFTTREIYPKKNLNNENLFVYFKKFVKA